MINNLKEIGNMVVKLSYKTLLFFLCVMMVAALCFWAERQPRFSVTVNTAPKGTPVPIIMYHHIMEQEEDAGDYVITPQEFENDLVYLKSKGYTGVTGAQLIEYAENGTPLPEKPVFITFDDGYESTYRYAFPLLKKHGFPAAVSIVGKFADIYSGSIAKDISYSQMNWQQIKELSDSGIIEIGNHTYDMHEANGSRKGCRINEGESEEQYAAALADDIGRLQDKINVMTGKKPQIFAYPFGFFCRESVDTLKQMGIRLSLGCEEGTAYVSDSDSLINMKRYNRAHGKTSEAFFKKILK